MQNINRDAKRKSLPIIASLVFLSLIALSTVPINRPSNIFSKTGSGSITKIISEAQMEPVRRFDIDPVVSFTFSDDEEMKQWEEKMFKGQTLYSLEKDGVESYVRAKSRGDASALYYKIELDVRKRRPAISWRWKIVKFPDKSFPESIESITEHEFAARVYIIFPARFFTNSKVLEYVYAEDLPVGSVGTSPYSQNIKMIVVSSGHAEDGDWVEEERDILSDYRVAFGGEPEHKIGAIAIMTNSDHTFTGAEAMYDDISVGYKLDGEKGKPTGGAK